MSFNVKNLDLIRTAILANWRSLNPNIAVEIDSDNYIRATGIASEIEGLYQHQEWGVRQQFAETADLENLIRKCAERSMTQKAAVEATGSVRMTGTVGAAIALGTAFTVGSVGYITTAAAIIGAGGTVDIAAQAVLAGLAGNQAASNVAATLTSAPSGINSAATLLDMTSGDDIESRESLLARYLDLLRQPPRGGSQSDWRRWAEEVPGVSRAYVYPLRSGLGTVDVCLKASAGSPSLQLIQSVVDHIALVAPVDVAAYNIVAPTPLAVPVTAQLTLANGYTLVAVTDAITTALTAYFSALAPGTVVIKSQIAALIADADGVLDSVLSAPTTNVAPTVDISQIGLAVLGTVTLT